MARCREGATDTDDGSRPTPHSGPSSPVRQALLSLPLTSEDAEARVACGLPRATPVTGGASPLPGLCHGPLQVQPKQEDEGRQAAGWKGGEEPGTRGLLVAFLFRPPWRWMWGWASPAKETHVLTVPRSQCSLKMGCGHTGLTRAEEDPQWPSCPPPVAGSLLGAHMSQWAPLCNPTVSSLGSKRGSVPPAHPLGASYGADIIGVRAAALVTKPLLS